MKTTVGMITIGQAPRVDVVPEMAELMGPGVQIVERGALDGLTRAEIDTLAPGPGDGILVTRLADGSSVFVAKRHVTSRVQERIEELERLDVAFTVLLCTGAFRTLRATRPLVEPDKVLRGVLRGIVIRGRLGILTPSARHVTQTEARWCNYGFDPVVVPLSPYGERDACTYGEPTVEGAVAAFRAGGADLVLMDCIGFRRATRERIRAALGVPVILANRLVARLVAELAGA
jgi:protein AroM